LQALQLCGDSALGNGSDALAGDRRRQPEALVEIGGNL